MAHRHFSKSLLGYFNNTDKSSDKDRSVMIQGIMTIDTDRDTSVSGSKT